MDEPRFKRRRQNGNDTAQNEEIIRLVRLLVKKGYRDRKSFFNSRTEIPEIGRSPCTLLNLILSRKVDGKSYLGHGSFDAFLKNELGVEHKTRLPDNMDVQELTDQVKRLANGKRTKNRKEIPKTEAEKLEKADALLRLHQNRMDFTSEHVLAYLLYHHHDLSYQTVANVLNLSRQKTRSLIETATRHIERTNGYGKK